MRFLLLLLFAMSIARCQTNSTIVPPITEVVKSDGTLTTKITYDSQVEDICVVSYNNGQNKIIMYGLPADFAAGDSLEGTFYPVGTKVAGDKKYHAFAVSKVVADSARDSHVKRIEELEVEIAKERKQRNLLENIAVMEFKTDGADSTDGARTQQEIKNTDAEIERDKAELVALRRD